MEEGPPGASPSAKRRSHKVLAGTSGALVVLMIAVGVVAWRTMGIADVLDVALVPIEAETEHPFTDPVTLITDDEVSAFITRLGTPQHGAKGGADQELYDAWSEPVCDRDALVRMVTADADRAAAWAGAMGIGPSAIASVVESLVPGLLTRDAAVTDHHYEGGRAVGYPVILQRGTAVLRDANGSPRVRCASGDPLSTPTFDPSTPVNTVGTSWPDYRPQQVVHVDDDGTITTGSSAGAGSVAGGQQTAAPDGADGVDPRPRTLTVDGDLVVGEDDVRIVDADGTETVVYDAPVADARDDGDGGLVFQTPRVSHEVAAFDGATTVDDPGAVPSPGPAAGSETVGTGSAADSHLEHDLVGTVPDDADEAAIWWLPSGSRKAIELRESDDPSKHWFAMLSTGTLQNRRVLVYADLRIPTDEDTTAAPVVCALEILDLDDVDAGATTVSFGDVPTPAIHRVRSVTITNESLLIGFDGGRRDAPTWYLAESSADGTLGEAVRLDTDAWEDFDGAAEAALTEEGDFVTLVPHSTVPGDGRAERTAQVRLHDPETGEKLESIDVPLDDEPGGVDAGADGSRIGGVDRAGDPRRGSVGYPRAWDTSGDVAVGLLRNSDGRIRAVRIDLHSREVAPLEVAGLVRVLRGPVTIPLPDGGAESLRVDSTGTPSSAPPTTAHGGGRLGVTTESATSGVAIIGVDPGSAADAAGLEVGDVIVAVGVDRIGTYDTLVGVLAKRVSGDRVELTVERDGTEVVVPVTLD